MSTDEDRIRYLAGEPSGALDPREQAELDDVRKLLADRSLWVEPPSDLEDAVAAAIAAEAGAPAHVAPPPAAAAGVASIHQARRRRLVTGLGAAAAALLLVVAVVAIRDDGGDEGVSIALRPTELAPDANGTARVVAEDSGLRISLDATGLPRRDGGLFYQAWLRNDAGVLVPIGTFHDGEDVTLWAGVALEEYPTLTVTEEVADGDQASSGRRVLSGTVGN